MNPDKRYWLCNECAEEGQKKYGLYLTYWKHKEKGVCQRCKKECYGAEYRLAEKDSQEPFHLGAHIYK